MQSHNGKKQDHGHDNIICPVNGCCDHAWPMKRSPITISVSNLIADLPWYASRWKQHDGQGEAYGVGCTNPITFF
jgi:hypothetical protein